MPSNRHRTIRGYTLIEILCVMGIITVLAGLLLGPLGRALRRARAMQWAQDSQEELHRTVQELRAHFRGMRDFPTITLEVIAAGHLLEPSQLCFLKDRRVTFFPFAGADPDDKVVILVKIEPGFLTEAGFLTETKGAITKAD